MREARNRLSARVYSISACNFSEAIDQVTKETNRRRRIPVTATCLPLSRGLVHATLELLEGAPNRVKRGLQPRSCRVICWWKWQTAGFIFTSSLCFLGADGSTAWSSNRETRTRITSSSRKCRAAPKHFSSVSNSATEFLWT